MGTPSLPSARERLIQLITIFKNDTTCKELNISFYDSNKYDIIYSLENQLQIPHQECNFNILFLKLFTSFCFVVDKSIRLSDDESVILFSEALQFNKTLVKLTVRCMIYF